MEDMKETEKMSIEIPCQSDGESSIDTQMEVDLICGGVGFDDGPTDDATWLKVHRDTRERP